MVGVMEVNIFFSVLNWLRCENPNTERMCLWRGRGGDKVVLGGGGLGSVRGESPGSWDPAGTLFFR